MVRKGDGERGGEGWCDRLGEKKRRDREGGVREKRGGVRETRDSRERGEERRDAREK